MMSLGPSAPAASAGSLLPGPSLLPGRRPWPRGSKTLKFQVVFLLLNFINTVTANPIGDHPSDPQRVEQSPSEGTCTPGYHLSVENGACVPCKNGIDYTSSSNKLPSCMPCSACKEDKKEKSKCTTTNNTECQCKTGTFEDENSPEFCQKCSECTNEEVEETPCTPKTNRKCVHQGSCSDRCIGLSVIVIVIVIVIAFVVWKTGVWRKVLQYVKGAYPGCEQDSGNLNTLRGQTSNVGKDSHYSPAAKAPEEPEVAEDSPMGRKLQVPANENDSVDEQPHVAYAPHIQRHSNGQSCNTGPRRYLIPNADEMAQPDRPECLHQQSPGCLEAIGQWYTRDTIEDHAVKFIYQKTTV